MNNARPWCSTFDLFFLIFFFFFFLRLLLFFLFSVVRADAKTRKTSSKNTNVKKTISFCENSIFGSRWTGVKGVRSGPLEGDPAFMFFIFHFFRRKSFFFFFFVVFLSNIFYCWRQYQNLTVSSVVGVPWRCGALTTWSGRAGIGLGHLLGREHDSTLQTPLPVKRSSSRLDCCCC